MISLNLSILIFFLVTIQSIIGVGVLVLGTPILLLLNFDMVTIMSLLLPVSIITSTLNLVYFKIKKNNFKVDKEVKYKFFFICIPFIFFGLILLKFVNNLLNFEIIVSIIIIISVLTNILKKDSYNIGNNLRKIILALIGIVHGLTNSGGTLLSLFISSQSNKNNSRFSITFFYLFLALFQFLIFIFIFDLSNVAFLNFKIFLLIILAVVNGNFLINYINEKLFKISINIICIIASVVLLTK